GGDAAGKAAFAIVSGQLNAPLTAAAGRRYAVVLHDKEIAHFKFGSDSSYSARGATAKHVCERGLGEPNWRDQFQVSVIACGAAYRRSSAGAIGDCGGSNKYASRGEHADREERHDKVRFDLLHRLPASG